MMGIELFNHINFYICRYYIYLIFFTCLQSIIYYMLLYNDMKKYCHS